jgi:formylglycine-generating enzyme required for sulfatase activity
MARGALLLFFLFPCFAMAQRTPPDGMVLVTGGDFTMGSERSEGLGPNIPRGYNDSRPSHTMNLPAFFIDKTEITNAQYKKYCDATGYPPPPNWRNGVYTKGEDDFPVTHVTWYEAGAYAAWAGKRLPTEAEWEKAARGTDKREFPWGNNWDPKRIVFGRSRSDKVGQFPTNASPYGALDMAGNVYEWTQSWYDAYPNAPIKFPEYGEKMKVIRGGGFEGYDSIARTYYRSVAFPGTRSEWIGFRCVKDAN